ncbi:hypothetical protein Tco_0508031 [Tanacetum coccineum]
MEASYHKAAIDRHDALDISGTAGGRQETAMAALDSPANTLLFVIYYLMIILTRPPSSDPSLLRSSTSIPSTKSAAISIIPALSTKFTATPHVLSTTPVHATFNPVISTLASQNFISWVVLMRRRDLVFDYEASIEADAKADSEANGKIGSEAGVRTNVEDEAYTKDYDTHIRKILRTDVEAHAHDGVEAEIEVVFPMSTIIVRLVENGKAIWGMCENLLEMPTQRLEEIEEELRVQRDRAEVSKIERDYSAC